MQIEVFGWLQCEVQKTKSNGQYLCLEYLKIKKKLEISKKNKGRCTLL